MHSARAQALSVSSCRPLRTSLPGQAQKCRTIQAQSRRSRDGAHATRSVAPRAKLGSVLEALNFGKTKLSKISFDKAAIPEHWKHHAEGLTDGKKRALAGYFDTVNKINAAEPALQQLSDDQLKAKTQEFRQRLKRGATLESLLVEAFAVVREVSSRVLRLRHFDAQLVGGIVLHEGKVAEMATGEGKTLVATLPTYLNALTGKGVHVVTVNDYLAERDGEWMGKIFKFLGLSVGIVTEAEMVSHRKEPFECDITYTTAQSLCFTYLHDQTCRDADWTAINRPFNYAVVDEVDSLLIDDCRNPMIISGLKDSSSDRFTVAKEVIAGLVGHTEDESNPKKVRKGKQTWDFVMELKSKQASLTEGGLAKVYNALVERNHLKAGLDPVAVWQTDEPWGPFIINALKAEHLFHRNIDYIVTEDTKEINIINRSTGRVLSRTRWQDNMHQAVEAKENVKIGRDSVTQASVTFQCFFRYYAKLAGMTGTASTESEELYNVYRLNVVTVPSRLPNLRIDHPLRMFPDTEAKFVSLYMIVIDAYQRGRPVLIGTSSVTESEFVFDLLRLQHTWNPTARRVDAHGRIAPFWKCCDLKGQDAERSLLRARDIPIGEYAYEVSSKDLAVLNAKPENVRREAQIIAQAGLPGAVTIATNMAGRGTDIVLGGNPKGLALQVLMKLYARNLLTESVYTPLEWLGIIQALDQVPLKDFAWSDEVSIHEQPRGAKFEADCPWDAMEYYLTENNDWTLIDRLQRTYNVASASRVTMTLEQAQESMSQILEQAEAIQMQVLTDTWGGIGNFDVQQHAAEARRKLDKLFKNDEIPAFQQPRKRAQASSQNKGFRPAAMATNSSSKAPKLGLETQKHIAWAAVHLLLFLEAKCQKWAAAVKEEGGLLVVGINPHESKRTELQLKGRAARQGDPGETLMMYDVQDNFFVEALSVSLGLIQRSLWKNEDMLSGDRYWQGAILDRYMTPLLNTLESQMRGGRAETQQFDEVMESFRQHTYSLRQLILQGSNEQSVDILRLYFQDQADRWVAACIDARKPVKHWDWDKLFAVINKLLEEPEPEPRPAPKITISGFVELNQPSQTPTNPSGTPSNHPSSSALSSSSASAPAASSASSYGSRQSYHQPSHLPSDATTSGSPPQLQPQPSKLQPQLPQLGPRVYPASPKSQSGTAPDESAFNEAAINFLKWSSSLMPKKEDEEVRMDLGGMEEEEWAAVRQALEQNQDPIAPKPLVLDLGYKAKVAAHRRMIQQETANGNRQRIKGRSGAHAEQLRNWLGEFLLAKYEQNRQFLSKGGTAFWEMDMMLDTLDDIWMHFLRDTSSLQHAVNLRSFSRLDPVQEFKLEAGALFLQALVNFRQECVYQAFREPPQQQRHRSFAANWAKAFPQQPPPLASKFQSDMTTPQDSGLLQEANAHSSNGQAKQESGAVGKTQSESQTGKVGKSMNGVPVSAHPNDANSEDPGNDSDAGQSARMPNFVRE